MHGVSSDKKEIPTRRKSRYNITYSPTSSIFLRRFDGIRIKRKITPVFPALDLRPIVKKLKSDSPQGAKKFSQRRNTAGLISCSSGWHQYFYRVGGAVGIRY